MSSPIAQTSAQNSTVSSINDSLDRIKKKTEDCLAQPWAKTALRIGPAVINVIAHAYLGSIFMHLPLAAGAIIGAACWSTSGLVAWIGNKISLPDNSCISIAKWAVGFFGGLAAGIALTKAAGCAIAFKTAFVLHLATNGAIIAGSLATGGTLVAIGLAGVILHTMIERSREVRQS